MALLGQHSAHSPHRMQSSLDCMGSGGISAAVKTDTKRTRGPNPGVRMHWFIPIVPSPAYFAAGTWPKAARLFSRRARMDV